MRRIKALCLPLSSRFSAGALVGGSRIRKNSDVCFLHGQLLTKPASTKHRNSPFRIVRPADPMLATIVATLKPLATPPMYRQVSRPHQ